MKKAQNKLVIDSNSLLLYLILALLAAYVVLRGSFGSFYSQANTTTMQYTAGGSGHGIIAIFLSCSALMFIFILSVSVYNRTRHYFTSNQRICIALIMLTSICWIFIDLFTASVRELLGQSTSCFIYLIAFGAYIGADKQMWNKLKVPVFLLSVALIPLSFIYILSFISTYTGRIGNSPQIIYLSTGFWPLAISSLCYQYEKKGYLFILQVLQILALLVSIIFGTRGWVVQSALLMLVYYSRSHQGKRRRKSIIGTIALLLLVILAVWFILSNFFPSYWNVLLARLNSDTRSWQYQDIFSQTSFWNFLIGQGTFATYVSTLYGDYKFIDNVFLYLLFHYGFLMTISYLVFLISPIVKSRKWCVSSLDKMPAFVLFMWVLANAGLSIYNAPMIDVKTFLIVVLVGRSYRNIFEGKQKGGKTIL